MGALSNPATCALAFAVLVTAWHWRDASPSQVLDRVAAALSRVPVLVLLALLLAAQCGARVALALVAPGDIAGEFAAAETLVSRGVLYADANELASAGGSAGRGTLGSALAPWLPTALASRAALRDDVRIAAQAHPPTLLLAVAPLVWAFGRDGTTIFLAALTLGAAAWMGLSLAAAFAPALPVRGRLAVALLAASWQPVLASTRDGQISVLLAALATGAWALTRAGRHAGSGALVGVAAALKLYPGVLIVALLHRRRSVAASLLVAGGAWGLVMALAGPAAFEGFSVAAARAVAVHGESVANLSVRARLAALLPDALVNTVYLGLALLLVVLTAGRIPSRTRVEDTDFRFGQACCLAVLLPPITWHHYLAILAHPIAVVVAAGVRTGRSGLLLAGLVLALAFSLPLPVGSQLWTGGRGDEFAGAFASQTTAVMALWCVLAVLRARHKLNDA